MRPKQKDSQPMLFTSKLEQILNDEHPLYQLAKTIDWSEFDNTFGKLYDSGFGRPAKPTRLMVGLHYLKYTYNLSDEAVVERWIENPYWQYFRGEQFFQHEFPIDPTSMTPALSCESKSGGETGLKTRGRKSCLSRPSGPV